MKKKWLIGGVIILVVSFFGVFTLASSTEKFSSDTGNKSNYIKTADLFLEVMLGINDTQIQNLATDNLKTTTLDHGSWQEELKAFRKEVAKAPTFIKQEPISNPEDSYPANSAPQRIMYRVTTRENVQYTLYLVVLAQNNLYKVDEVKTYSL